MALKLVIDGCFVNSSGSVNVVLNIVEELKYNFEHIEIITLERDLPLFLNESSINDITVTSVSNYMEGIWKLMWLKGETTVLSLNNIPTIAPFLKKRVMLLHNIFYVYSLKELFLKRKIIRKPFFLRYIFFHIFVRIFRPSKIMVQTHFMKDRVKKNVNQDSCVVNTVKSDFESICEKSIDIKYDLLIIGGNETHKNILNTLNFLNDHIDNIESIFTNKLRIGVIGYNKVNSQSFNKKFKSNFHLLGIISQSEVLKCIKSSKVCLIPSLAESYCLSIMEVVNLKKPLVIIDEEYSRELLKSAYFYEADNSNLISTLKFALSDLELCALKPRDALKLNELQNLLNDD